jgi:hypothetical protein
MRIGKNRFQRFVQKNVASVLMGPTLPKNRAQMTHRAAAHVPIRHLLPGQLRSDGAYLDQGPIF